MNYRQEYEKWVSSPAITDEERAELRAIADDDKEIESRFYGPLEFGTAGLRGTMKMGLHQMNVYVIRWATQGFAKVICAEGEEAKRRGVAICMDCRNHSMDFARAAAEGCAANGIHVRIFESLRPTPELSFAVRHYGCQAGINVTASHNPKEYNGYKVYWADGAQLPPPHAAALAAEAHDTLAHSLSLMALNASALKAEAAKLGDSPEAQSLADKAEDIRRQSAGALDEAHSIIDMLRNPRQAWEQLAPSGDTSLTRESLDALIADTRNSGTSLNTWIDIQQLSVLDESIGKVAYRAIQEGLTNARRHAPGEPVSL